MVCLKRSPNLYYFFQTLSFALFFVLLSKVSEVLANKTRLSVSGWFHGPPIVRPSPFKELAPVKEPPVYLQV